MKKYLYLLLLLATTITAKAQPSLTSASIPSIGETYTYTSCDTLNVRPGEAGANKTWNFANLTEIAGTTSTHEIISPSAAVGNSNFPSATYALKSGDGYLFYKSSSSQVERLGTGYESGGEKLTDFELVNKFPFTYDNKFEDNFSGTLVTDLQGQTFTLTRSGKIEIEADGYGTVITPKGTFTNVLRIKAVQTITDEMPSPVPGFPGVTIKTETVSYSWVSDDYKYSLLTISFIKSEQNAMGQSQTTYSGLVSLFDAEPSAPSLVQPTILSPSSGQSGITIPFTIKWSSAEGTTVAGVKSLAIDDIKYTVQVSTDPTWADDTKIIELSINKITEIDFNDRIETENLACRVKAERGTDVTDWSPAITFEVVPNVVNLPSLSLPANGAKFKTTETITFEVSPNEILGGANCLFSFEGPKTFDTLVQNAFSIALVDFPKGDYTWKAKAINTASNESEWTSTRTFSVEEEIISVWENVAIESIGLVENDLLKININSDATEYNVDIINLSGERLISLSSPSNEIKININQLQSGLYFVSVRSNVLVKMYKFIKL